MIIFKNIKMFKKIVLIVLLGVFLFCTMDFVSAETRDLWNETIKEKLLWSSENDILPKEEDGLNLLQAIVDRKMD